MSYVQRQLMLAVAVGSVTLLNIKPIMQEDSWLNLGAFAIGCGAVGAILSLAFRLE